MRTSQSARARPTTGRGRSRPPVSVCVSATIGALVGSYPSGLPRDGWVAGALLALCVAVGTGLGMAGSAVTTALRRRRSGGQAPTRHIRRGPHRHVIPIVCAVLVAGSVALNVCWQNTLRSDLGFPAAGVGWTVQLVVPAALVYAAITATPRASIAGAGVIVALCVGVVPATAATPADTPLDADPTVLSAPAGPGTPADRADALVHRWADAGGVSDDAVVVAVPTGSGWVDPAAVTAIREHFGGRVHLLVLPYADSESWQVFVADRGSAGRAAVALTDRLAACLEAGSLSGPAGRRPAALYLYGQSLGAVGAETARAHLEASYPGMLAGTLLAGAPADTVGDVRRGQAPRVVFANAGDPVARWSLDLLWRPEHPTPGTRVVGRHMPRPPWLPVVSFVQTSTDLLAALDGPVGVGHRYGSEQGQLPGPVAASQPTGPRAAS